MYLSLLVLSSSIGIGDLLWLISKDILRMRIHGPTRKCSLLGYAVFEIQIVRLRLWKKV